MDTFHIKLDLDKSRPIINEPIGIRQNDGSVTTIVAEIFDHGQPATDLGTGISFRCIRPDFTKYIETKNIDVSGNTITFKTSAKLSKEPGLIKIAHFLIGGDSTQDFLIDVKRGVFFTDDDYLKITSSFKGRKRLDRNSNPNEIWILNINPKDSTTSTFKSNPQEVETSDDVYELFNNPKEPFDKFKYVYTGVSFALMYLFKIDPKTVKIRINNLYIGKSNGEDIPDEHSFANTKGIVSPIPQIYVANKMTGITDDVGNTNGYGYKIFYNHSEKYLTPDLNLSGYKPLQNESIDNKTIYTNSFELDLTKNNFLTSDNYLMLTVHSHYIPWKEGSPFNGYQCICVSPQIECIQYYLPE